MEAKKKNKKKTTESVGNTIEEGEENGERWREMRDQKMTMSVIMMMMIMMMMIRKRSNKQEKEKNSKRIIRQIGKSKAKFNLQQAMKARTGRRGIVLLFLEPRPR